MAIRWGGARSRFSRDWKLAARTWLRMVVPCAFWICGIPLKHLGAMRFAQLSFVSGIARWRPVCLHGLVEKEGRVWFLLVLVFRVSHWRKSKSLLWAGRSGTVCGNLHSMPRRANIHLRPRESFVSQQPVLPTVYARTRRRPVLYSSEEMLFVNPIT